MTAEQRVRIYMARHNLSQQGFASRVGCAQNSVSLILRGYKPRIALAYKLAPVLGVKPETLMR